MKKLGIAAIAATLCWTVIEAAQAQTTVNISGLNGWSDLGAQLAGYGSGGTGTEPVLVSNAMNYGTTPPPAGYQSGCLVIGPMAGYPLAPNDIGRMPNVSIPNTDATDVTTLTMYQYVPSTTTTGWGFWDSWYNPSLIWETAYITGGTAANGYAQQNNWGNGYGVGGSYNFVFKSWQEIKYVWDPANGFSEYYGTPGSMTLTASMSVADASTLLSSFGGSWPYPINNFGWLVESDYIDATHPVQGPVYYDNMQLQVGNSVVWSDNFDNYIHAETTTNYTWVSTPGTGTTNWSTSSNWDAGTPQWSASTSVTVGNLGTTGTLDLLSLGAGTAAQDEIVGQLTFNGQVPATIQSSGQPIPATLLVGTPGGPAVPITVNHDAATGTHTNVISAPMTISTSANITVVNASDKLDISGPIGGSGRWSLPLPIWVRWSSAAAIPTRAAPRFTAAH